MDAFSEILSGVKLNGAVFFSAEFSAPWGFSAPATNTPNNVMVTEFGAGAAHLVLYHFVIDGGAVVELANGQTIELKPGDVVIFPHGDLHYMSSGKGAKGPFPSYEILAKIKSRDLSPLHAGGGGETSRFVCGYMTCDPYLSRPILNGLPPVFKVNIRTDRAGHWLENSILHLVEEAASGRVGSEAMLAKLSEALFVDTLRRYVAGLPDQQMGWLAGARRSHRGKKPRIAAWPRCPSVDDRGSRGKGGRFTVRSGGALYPISLRAANGIFDPLEASIGRAIPRKNIARRRGSRSRCRIRIGGGLQSRIQA